MIMRSRFVRGKEFTKNSYCPKNQQSNNFILNFLLTKRKVFFCVQGKQPVSCKIVLSNKTGSLRKFNLRWRYKAITHACEWTDLARYLRLQAAAYRLKPAIASYLGLVSSSQLNKTRDIVQSWRDSLISKLPLLQQNLKAQSQPLDTPMNQSTLASGHLNASKDILGLPSKPFPIKIL